MNRVKFAIYDTPANKSQKQTPYARLISSGTKGMKEVCKHINECSSLTSSDIKGVLDALSQYIGFQLSNGYSVELDGLGYFYPALKTQEKEVKEDGRVMYSVSVEGVNFRCSPGLKEMVKDSRPEKVKRKNKSTISREERKALILEYLKTHHVFNISDYAELNHCTYYTAQNDIKYFEEEGSFESEGYRTHRIYKLVEKGKKISE